MADWDFTANAEVDEAALGNAPEGYRGAYEKGDDGKFRIAAAYKPFVDAISGLGGALKNERNTSKALKGQKDVSEQLRETLGFDTLEEAKAKLDELNGAVASASKVDPAKIKADIQKGFDAQMATKDGEIKTMQSTLSRYMVDNAAITALAAAKGNDKLLMPIIREAVELVKDGDDYVVRVKDGAGDYRGNGKGGFLSVEELVAELRASKDYGAAFESDGTGGTLTRTGVRPGEQQSRQMQRTANDGDRNATDRIQAGLQARRSRR